MKESWGGTRTVGLVHEREGGVMPWDVYVGTIFIGPCTDSDAEQIKKGVYLSRPDSVDRVLGEDK